MSITRTQFTRQFEHVANVRHGVATGPWRIEFDAAVKDEQASLGINQGSVVSLDANGQFVIGCGNGSGVNRPVPFISMKNVADPDVTTGIGGLAEGTYTPAGGTATTIYYGSEKSTYSAMGGKITAIPCTCGYELETTEFVKGVGVTYAPNDGLKAAASDNIGKVAKATAAPGTTEAYLGFVSVAPSMDYFGNQRIAFFTNFIPAGAITIPEDGNYTKVVVSGGAVTFGN